MAIQRPVTGYQASVPAPTQQPQPQPQPQIQQRNAPVLWAQPGIPPYQASHQPPQPMAYPNFTHFAPPPPHHWYGYANPSPRQHPNWPTRSPGWMPVTWTLRSRVSYEILRVHNFGEDLSRCLAGTFSSGRSPRGFNKDEWNRAFATLAAEYPKHWDENKPEDAEMLEGLWLSFQQNRLDDEFKRDNREQKERERQQREERERQEEEEREQKEREERERQGANAEENGGQSGAPPSSASLPPSPSCQGGGSEDPPSQKRRARWFAAGEGRPCPAKD
ncbi:hypothetical protein PG995_011030 [Apiospora arundinis]